MHIEHIPDLKQLRVIDIQISVSMATDGRANAEQILATTLPCHKMFTLTLRIS
jgi:hypothetical protein